jgi:hypothetical protein
MGMRILELGVGSFSSSLIVLPELSPTVRFRRKAVGSHLWTEQNDSSKSCNSAQNVAAGYWTAKSDFKNLADRYKTFHRSFPG